MIGSFWNLCRACPSMPVDKLHSEYRSTYRWHEFTGSSRPEVVRRAPTPNQSQFPGATNEPPLPRRKKCPELAYKSHEFIIGSEYTDARSNAATRMARSEERGTPARRSKSEGPPAVPNGRAYAIPKDGEGLSKKQAATLHELEPLVSDAEYKKPNEKHVMFAEKKTPRIFSQTFDQERINHFITKKENFGFDAVDNKQSDGAVLMNGSAPPHSHPDLDLWFKEVVELRKKADEYKCRGWGVEIDPELYKKQRDLWEQVSKRSSLSALSLASTLHRPITKEEKEQENNKKSVPITKSTQKPRIPGQAFMIDHKEEGVALPARFAHIRHHLERTTGPDVEDGALLPSPTREKLMPAMTKRESESQRGSPKKTAVSRHGSPQKGSPQKGSPKKIPKTRSQSVGPDHDSPKRRIRSTSTAPGAKGAPYGKKATQNSKTPTPGATTERKPRPSTLSTTFHSRMKSSSLPPSSDRANSVPATTNQLHHQKKQSQSIASSQTNAKTKSPQLLQMCKKDKDRTNLISISNNLNTNKMITPKSRSKMAIPIGNAAKFSTVNATITTTTTTTTTNPTITTTSTTSKKNFNINDIKAAADGDSGIKATDPFIMTQSHLTLAVRDNKFECELDGEEGRGTAISILSASPQPPADINEEPLIKSPPEPTRVKSPEQIIMRSPDPVNWTVPLDTGKIFTVTQNVKNGEHYSRPQSEIKASTPVEKPPPPPQSAPPQLTEQTKMDGKL